MEFITPDWLEDATTKIACLPRKEVLEEQRLDSDKANLPWPYFLEDKIVEAGESPYLLLEYLARRFPTFPPIILDSCERLDVASRFPIELQDNYYVIPFNESDSFLSLAIVDPELLRTFNREYIDWAKENTFSLLQYFITLPSSFSQYRS